jgi:type II secretory pathway pseudopilin PulG
MGTRATRTRRVSLRSSDGWTLFELLFAMSMFIVVLTAAGAVLGPSQRDANSDIENSTSQAESQAQLDRMVRELRQGTDIVTASPNQMTVLINGNQVSYRCDYQDLRFGSTYNACYRLTAGAPPAALPSPTVATEVVPRLSNGTLPVFDYTVPTVDESAETDDEASDANNTPDPLSPTYVKISLRLPAKGELSAGGRSRTVALDTGFALRNIRYHITNGIG